MPVISYVPGVETPDVLSGAATKVSVPELVMPPPLKEKLTVSALLSGTMAQISAVRHTPLKYKFVIAISPQNFFGLVPGLQFCTSLPWT
jgi:hypothetical protein